MTTIVGSAGSISTASYVAIIGLALFGYFILLPTIIYFRDAKGLRKFANFAPFSGMFNFPFMVLAHGGARSSYLSKLHQEQPILRTGPNTLSFGSVRAIKDIYGHSTPCIKDESYIISSGSHFHLADVVDKSEHARKRKVLSMAYAIKHLVAWEHKVADKVERLIKHFDKCCTAPPTDAGELMNPHPDDIKVDFREWTNYFSLDAIVDIGLSERLGLLDQGHDLVDAQLPNGSMVKRNLRECLYPTARKQSLLLWTYDWYKIINKISNIIPFYRRMSESSKGWDAIVQRRAALRFERYQAGEKLDDFFQALMESKSGVPNSLPWGETVAEINIMMNAGSVTTAIAIANVMYQLLKNREILEKLKEEVDAVMEAGEVVAKYEVVRHLPYLKACLDESLRLWPPTPHGLPRKTPPEGMLIMDTWVPGNTTVSISSLVAHRDPTAFSDPDQYIPDRWMGDEGKKLQSSFIAFSTGARGCIGRNISYLEQTVMLASLVHRYDFALPRGFELRRLETMNHILGEMPVKVWRRESETKG